MGFDWCDEKERKCCDLFMPPNLRMSRLPPALRRPRYYCNLQKMVFLPQINQCEFHMCQSMFYVSGIVKLHIFMHVIQPISQIHSLISVQSHHF